MITIRGVLSTNVETAFPVILPMLEKALEYAHGELEAEDVKRALISRDMQLWVVMDDKVIKAVGITEIVNFPKLKTCRMLLAGGIEIDTWSHLMLDVEKWAKSYGCQRIDAVVRPGMARKLAKYGMRKLYETIGKTIKAEEPS